MSESYTDGVPDDTTYAPNDDDRAIAKSWLTRIDEAEKTFREYQDQCDKIDKLYADLKQLSGNLRDREFQLFWANVEVLKPSVYARPPVPVVTPRFQDKRPLYQTSSELLERSVSVEFDLRDVNGVMEAVRDDLVLSARGAPWVRYVSDKDGDRCEMEHLDRRDFLHEPARKWAAVGWVARRAWMNRKAMRERFAKTSGDAWQMATYQVEQKAKQKGAATAEEKAGVWEIWSKDDNEVIWVCDGCDVPLDRAPPHLDLAGFFPCPRPAYATLQPRTLMPVPDVMLYRDQLEEINALTRRIASLTESLRVRGFYPAGSGEIGDAVEKALAELDDRRVMVPVNNWSAFGGGSGEAIVWLPIEQVAQVITGCVELRRQMIEDVYQIIGLSDIMRGATDASETLGAQQLKSQYGSVRLRQKQNELARVARDLVRIVAEIQAEDYPIDTLVEMAQMEIPSDAQIREQMQAIEQAARQQAEQAAQMAQSDPQMAAQIQQNPQLVQEALDGIESEMQAQMQQLSAIPTREKIEAFLRDERIRPFVLDIETDSTIQPDENAEKERRAEFMQVLGGTLQQLGALVAAAPEAAPFASEVLKFAVAPYRAGRSLDGAIEQFAEQMAQRQQQPNPEQQAAAQKAQAEAQKIQAEMQAQQLEASEKQAEIAERRQLLREKTQAEIAAKQQEAADRQRETNEKIATMQAQEQREARKAQQDERLKALDIQLKDLEIVNRRQDAALNRQAAEDERVERQLERAEGGPNGNAGNAG